MSIKGNDIDGIKMKLLLNKLASCITAQRARHEAPNLDFILFFFFATPQMTAVSRLYPRVYQSWAQGLALQRCLHWGVEGRVSNMAVALEPWEPASWGLIRQHMGNTHGKAVWEFPKHCARKQTDLWIRSFHSVLKSSRAFSRNKSPSYRNWLLSAE